MQENESIKVATKELEQISDDVVAQRIAELREKARRDDKALFNTGKRIGKEQGREEGLQQGLTKGTADGERLAKEKIAQKMLSLNVPIEQIAEFTELSIEKIKKLSEN